MEHITYIVYEHRDVCKWYQRMLKDGYKHCWVLVHDGIGWFKIERVHGYLDVQNIHIVEDKIASEVDVVEYFKGRGCTLQSVDPLWFRSTDKMRVGFPYMEINNCVTAVKDYIGLGKHYILTPWQLHQHIEKVRNNGII